jgi:hypothetical protein
MQAGMTGALSTGALSTGSIATGAVSTGSVSTWHGSRMLPGAGMSCSESVAPAASTGLANPLLPLIVLLVAAVFLQRFAVPVAEGQLGVGLVIGLVVAGIGVLRGWLVVEPTRFVLFCVMLAGILATLALAGQGFSVLSLAMFVFLYLPFILVLPLDAATYRRLLGHLQTLLLIVAVSAMLQFAAQFVVGAVWMFPFDRLLPERLFIPGFNLVIEISGGIVKSTGLWLLEPSILSQLMAIGIVVELVWFRRPWVLATLITGLGLAFSGTGLMLLVVFLPLLLVACGLGGWLVVGLAMAALAVWAFADVFPISYFVSRLGEFGNPQASGSMRFFGPYWAVADVFAGRPDLLWTGVGPGGMADEVWNFDYAVQDSSWLKLIVEYGLIGGLPFAVFYAYCLFAGCPDRWLAAALLFQVLFLGGYLLGYHAQFLILALIVWPRLVPAPVAASTATTLPAQQPTSGRQDR